MTKKAALRLEIVADLLLHDHLDAIVGDQTTITDLKCFQSCALGGDVVECGIGDTEDTASRECDAVCDLICFVLVV